MFVYEAARTRPFDLAHTGRRCGDDLGRAAGLYARRHRLARATAYLAAGDRWIAQGGVAHGYSLRDNRHGAAQQCREAAIVLAMALDPAQLPDDITSLKAMLIEENRRATEAEALRA